VPGAAGALGVVEGAGAGRGAEGGEGLGHEASVSRLLRMNRAATIFLFPEARVMGLVPP
jgi:hypothetical protein